MRTFFVTSALIIAALISWSKPEGHSETVVTAPAIGAPAENGRPPVKQTITAAAVDPGWGALANQDEAKKIREKMKSEAASPSTILENRFAKADASMNGTTQRSETSEK